MAQPYTEARKQANRRYDRKAYDRIAAAVPKGTKARIDAAAAASGLSINGWITNAILEKLNSETPAE